MADGRTWEKTLESVIRRRRTYRNNTEDFIVDLPTFDAILENVVIIFRRPILFENRVLLSNEDARCICCLMHIVHDNKNGIYSLMREWKRHSHESVMYRGQLYQRSVIETARFLISIGKHIASVGGLVYESGYSRNIVKFALRVLYALLRDVPEEFRVKDKSILSSLLLAVVQCDRQKPAYGHIQADEFRDALLLHLVRRYNVDLEYQNGAILREAQFVLFECYKRSNIQTDTLLYDSFPVYVLILHGASETSANNTNQMLLSATCTGDVRLLKTLLDPFIRHDASRNREVLTYYMERSILFGNAENVKCMMKAGIDPFQSRFNPLSPPENCSNIQRDTDSTDHVDIKQHISDFYIRCTSRHIPHYMIQNEGEAESGAKASLDMNSMTDAQLMLRAFLYFNEVEVYSPGALSTLVLETPVQLPSS